MVLILLLFISLINSFKIVYKYWNFIIVNNSVINMTEYIKNRYSENI